MKNLSESRTIIDKFGDELKEDKNYAGFAFPVKEYKTHVKDGVVDVIMRERGISEKAFSLVDGAIKEVADNYGVFPPLSLAYVAAIEEKAGHDVQLIDANALKLTKEQTLRKIKNFSPDLLAFTITTYLFHQILEWIGYLKKETNLPRNF